MKFGIVGATGRVGQLLIKIIKEKNLELGSVIFEGNANGVVFPQNTVKYLLSPNMVDGTSASRI